MENIMTRNFLILLLLTTNNYATSDLKISYDYYNNYNYLESDYYDYENLDNYYTSDFNNVPKPLTTLPSIFEQLPIQEQNLINLAIAEFEIEIEYYSLELAPAITDLLQQKILLELELFNLTELEDITIQDLQNIQAIKQVISEKNQMLTNLILIKNTTGEKLYKELKLKLASILSRWLYTGNNTIDMLFNSPELYNNQFYRQDSYKRY